MYITDGGPGVVGGVGGQGGKKGACVPVKRIIYHLETKLTRYNFTSSLCSSICHA